MSSFKVLLNMFGLTSDLLILFYLLIYLIGFGPVKKNFNIYSSDYHALGNHTRQGYAKEINKQSDTRYRIYSIVKGVEIYSWSLKILRHKYFPILNEYPNAEFGFGYSELFADIRISGYSLTSLIYR